MEDEGRDWLLELLHEVQLDQFFVRIRDELQVGNHAQFKNFIQYATFWIQPFYFFLSLR